MEVYTPEDDVVIGTEFIATWDYDDGSGVTEVCDRVILVINQ